MRKLFKRLNTRKSNRLNTASSIMSGCSEASKDDPCEEYQQLATTAPSLLNQHEAIDLMLRSQNICHKQQQNHESASKGIKGSTMPSHVPRSKIVIRFKISNATSRKGKYKTVVPISSSSSAEGSITPTVPTECKSVRDSDGTSRISTPSLQTNNSCNSSGVSSTSITNLSISASASNVKPQLIDTTTSFPIKIDTTGSFLGLRDPCSSLDDSSELEIPNCCPNTVQTALSTCSGTTYSFSTTSCELPQERQRLDIFDDDERHRQPQKVWEYFLDPLSLQFSHAEYVEYVDEENVPIVQELFRQNTEVGRLRQLTTEEKYNVSAAIQALDRCGNQLCDDCLYDEAYRRFERSLYLKRQMLQLCCPNLSQSFFQLQNMESSPLLDKSQDDKLLQVSNTDYSRESISLTCTGNRSKSIDEDAKNILLSVAISINNVTYLKQRTGAASVHEIMEMYMAALYIKREVLGHNHFSVGKTLNNIGSVFYLQRLYQPALAAYQDAYQVMKLSMGNEDCLDLATVLSNIGDVYTCLCDRVKALENYRIALRIRWQLLGPQDPKVIRLMEQTATLELKLVNGGLTQPLESDSASESEDDEYILEDQTRHVQYLQAVNDLRRTVQEDLDFFDWMEHKASLEFIHDTTIVNQEIQNLYHDDYESCGAKHSSSEVANSCEWLDTSYSPNEPSVIFEETLGSDQYYSSTFSSSPVSVIEYQPKLTNDKRLDFTQKDHIPNKEHTLQHQYYPQSNTMDLGRKNVACNNLLNEPVTRNKFTCQSLYNADCTVDTSEYLDQSCSSVVDEGINITSVSELSKETVKESFHFQKPDFSLDKMSDDEKKAALAMVRQRLDAIRQARAERIPPRLLQKTGESTMSTITNPGQSPSSSNKSSRLIFLGGKEVQNIQEGLNALRSSAYHRNIIQNNHDSLYCTSITSNNLSTPTNTTLLSSTARREAILTLYKERKLNSYTAQQKDLPTILHRILNKTMQSSEGQVISGPRNDK